MVLELCSESLQKALQKKRWSFGERMSMALELVHGISYVHSMGTVHIYAYYIYISVSSKGRQLHALSMGSWKCVCIYLYLCWLSPLPPDHTLST